CTRPGSLDASITEEVANNFPALFAQYPNISHVFFNGGTAERMFRRHVLPALSEDHHVFARLPSTSPAHAAMRLKAKVRAWSVLKKVLSWLTALLQCKTATNITSSASRMREATQELTVLTLCRIDRIPFLRKQCLSQSKKNAKCANV